MYFANLKRVLKSYTGAVSTEVAVQQQAPAFFENDIDSFACTRSHNHNADRSYAIKLLKINEMENLIFCDFDSIRNVVHRVLVVVMRKWFFLLRIFKIYIDFYGYQLKTLISNRMSLKLCVSVTNFPQLACGMFLSYGPDNFGDCEILAERQKRFLRERA
jgi:hypothetical protein